METLAKVLLCITYATVLCTGQSFSEESHANRLEVHFFTHRHFPYFSCQDSDGDLVESQSDQSCFPLADTLRKHTELKLMRPIYHVLDSAEDLRDFLETGEFSNISSPAFALYLNSQLGVQENQRASEVQSYFEPSCSFDVPVYMVINPGKMSMQFDYCLSQIAGIWRSVGVLMGMSLAFGLIIYIFERDNHKSSFKHPFHGLYFAIVTLTGTGYGDKTPKTIEGRTLSILWMLSGGPFQQIC
jgi:hypothetical protein